MSLSVLFFYHHGYLVEQPLEESSALDRFKGDQVLLGHHLAIPDDFDLA